MTKKETAVAVNTPTDMAEIKEEEVTVQAVKMTEKEFNNLPEI